MGNACQPVGYSIDDGMKAFCVAEMCVGIFHLLMASVAFQGFRFMDEGGGEGLFVNLKKGEENKFMSGTTKFLSLFLALTLVGQFVMGLLLYFLAYKKRNVTICLIWIFVACINFIIQLLLLLIVVAFIDCREAGISIGRSCYFYTSNIWHTSYLYLLYVILGVWIVLVYMKWAKSTGIAVQYSSTPASGTAPSQSHRSAKVANQDNEA